MAKKSGKLSRRYAQAFLAAAPVRGTELVQLAKTLTEFAEYFESSTELKNALLSPAFPRPEREQALTAVLNSLNLPALLTQGISLLFRRSRLELLPELANAFSELARSSANVVQVEIVTASTLPADEMQRIERTLTPVVKGQGEFHWQVDPSLIGGMVVRYSGRVIDGSVAGRLGRLESTLIGGR